MGFPSALSAGTKTTLRTSGYWSRCFVCFNPGETVFRCRANETITNRPFIQFLWDTSDVGAYTDVLPGMVVYISSTTDIKSYKYRGRVRKSLTSVTFYIDLNATELEDGDYITVIRDVDLFAKSRNDTFIDSDVAYHNLPSMITGLPSALCLYDSDNDGNVSFAFTQSGIPVDSTATSSFTWLWTISGAGTTAFTVGSSTSQNPTIRFQAGYHYLVRCRVTDSNSVQHFVFVQIYAVTRTFAAPVIVQAVAGSVQHDLNSGYTGSITAYSGVTSLPYRTHAAVFCVEHFGDNSSTPVVTNVLMHGRLRSENITTEGSAEAGRRMQVTYPIEGITSYMQRLSVPNDMVRHQAVPNEWGEMVNPTPFRRAVYFLYAYTTLLNLVSFSAGDSLFDDWREAGEPISIDGGMALNALNTILDRIKAVPNYAPDGEIRCEITASYKEVRSGLTTIMDFLPTDAPSYALDIDTSKQTAQVTGYGGSWNTVTNQFVGYIAKSPTVRYSDSPETRELTRELLRYDNTAAESADELANRTGNDYAFQNAKWLINATLRGAHRWLVATNYQRYTWTIAASENTRGLAITTATKWQCQSVNLTINTDGTFGVDAQFYQETEFTDAQSIASQLPLNLPQQNPMMPVLSDYPAFPDDPLWMFPTDTPTLDEIGAIDPGSAYQAYSPFTPDQAAKAAEKAGTPFCTPFQVNLRNSGTVASDFNTTGATIYTVRVRGSGTIASDSFYSDAMHTGLGPKTFPLSSDLPMGAYAVQEGGGWIDHDGQSGPTDGCINGEFVITTLGNDYSQAVGVVDLGAEYDIISASFNYINDLAASDAPCQFRLYDENQVLVGYDDNFRSVTATWQVTSMSLTFGVATGVRYISFNSVAAIATPGGALNVKLDDLIVTYNGPDTEGDAFYQWVGNGAAEAYDGTRGLRVDGSAVATIPAFNDAHDYTFPYTGTGSPVTFGFADASYTDNSNDNLDINFCRPES